MSKFIVTIEVDEDVRVRDSEDLADLLYGLNDGQVSGTVQIITVERDNDEND